MTFLFLNIQLSIEIKVNDYNFVIHLVWDNNYIFEMLSYLTSSENFLLDIIISFLGLNGYGTCQIHAINKCMGSALNPSILDPNCKAFTVPFIIIDFPNT